jgi:hypothetical protein
LGGNESSLPYGTSQGMFPDFHSRARKTLFI